LLEKGKRIIAPAWKGAGKTIKAAETGKSIHERDRHQQTKTRRKKGRRICSSRATVTGNVPGQQEREGTEEPAESKETGFDITAGKACLEGQCTQLGGAYIVEKRERKL